MNVCIMYYVRICMHLAMCFYVVRTYTCICTHMQIDSRHMRILTPYLRRSDALRQALMLSKFDMFICTYMNAHAAIHAHKSMHTHKGVAP
jgi:hypothetical protein